MSKRLIDANALKEKILSLTLTVTGGRWSGKRVLIELLNKYRNGILQLVNEQPTVDAVEVIRCNECRWYLPECECCQFWHGRRHPDHFCSEGERK